MLNAKKIVSLFEALNEELRAKDVIGEVGICGGAVMCLVFNARKATKDIDGIFKPTKEIRQACVSVAHRCGVEPHWLNDAAKAYFHIDPPRKNILNLSNLRVWAPTADYMLAMKCLSARFDSHDKDDVQFLIRYLQLDHPDKVFEIVSKYYPRKMIPAKTRFLVEELLG